MGAYFDNNATTPIEPRVAVAMTLGIDHGNPSSAHKWGRKSREAIETARGQVAGLLGVQPPEIIFTGSGTEANNQVIYAAGRQGGFKGHLLTTTLEHPSIHAAAARMREMGMEVTEVPPDDDGVVQPEAIAESVRPDTRLACIMLANNELGTLQPVVKAAEICHEHGVPVLCDAVQAVGKIPVHPAELGIDFLTLGAHKFHGPLGAAALWVKSGLEVAPLFAGGGQEGGRRPGTENVHAIVGLGKACEIAAEELTERRNHLIEMRVTFERGLAGIDDAVIHATGALRLPNTTHVAFLGLSGRDLMMRLDEAGYAVSTGAACGASGEPLPSRTLLAMGISKEEALASLRVSFGMTNTVDEVKTFVETLTAQVFMLRAGA